MLKGVRSCQLLQLLRPRTLLPGRWSPASTQRTGLPQSAWPPALIPALLPPPQPHMRQMVQLKFCLQMTHTSPTDTLFGDDTATRPHSSWHWDLHPRQ